MKEIWKDIEGYENKYQISNLGNVKSLPRTTKFGRGILYREEKLLVSRKGKQGYLYVNLYDNNGKRTTYKIHRLVANAFLKNNNNYNCVNHKDENKENNCIENLEWCTQKYNANYGTSISRRSKKKSKKVNMFSLSGEFIRTYNSIKEAEKNNLLSTGEISRCCNGLRKSAYGFIWKFQEGGVNYANTTISKV